MITTLAISGYRSIRDLVLPLDQLTVVTGANGTGKSSLYRSLKLLADVAQGRLLSSLAAEGGFQSTLWAGPEILSRRMKSGQVNVQGTRRSGPVALKLGFASEDYSYAVDLGQPVPHRSAFDSDPEIKCESVWIGERLRPSTLLAERRGPSVRARSETGSWAQIATALPRFDSMMTHGADPRSAPELLLLRDRMRNWRFYDHLRTDRDAPARSPRIGTYTPVLAGDGGDLAAAIQTIHEIGDGRGFDAAIDAAFPGSEIRILRDNRQFGLEMTQHGLLRPLSASELSDGTLRFILLAAALFTPRAPGLMVLNEPETSLHPDLIPPLARMIASASQHSQIIVVSHASALTDALSDHGALCHALTKDLGETTLPDADPISWEWPKR